MPELFYGEFRHTVDDKGRVSLPAKFRSELGEFVVVSKGFEPCLFVFTQALWNQVLERLTQQSSSRQEQRDFNRHLMSGANDVEVDTHGRILLPLALRHYAGIEREAVLVGLGKHLEIWDRVAYEQYMEKTALDYKSTAATIIDIGF